MSQEAMDEQELRQIADDINGLISELGGIHKELHSLQDSISELEKRAARAGVDRLESALKDAFLKLSRSGQQLSDAHAKLNLPSDAYTVAGASAPAEGAQG